MVRGCRMCVNDKDRHCSLWLVLTDVFYIAWRTSLFKRPKIYLFKTYLLSIYSIPGSVLGIWIKSVNKRGKKILFCVIIKFTLEMGEGSRPRTMNIIKK